MPLPPNNPGFDAFFQAITTSPEFKSAVTKDWKWDSMDALEKSLLDMQSSVEQASGIMKWFEGKFATDEAKDIGNSASIVPKGETSDGQGSPPKTGNPGDEDAIPPLKVEHFVKKDPANWGFAGVAGMEKLKEELKDSFIKPLKFKFLVEKLKKEQVDVMNWWQANKGESEGDKLSETDDKLWKWWAKASEFLSPSEPFGSFQLWKEGNLQGNKDTLKNDLILKLYTEYEKFKISIPTGMLFYGPPGTGKTFITRKLAEELDCGFISKNMGEFGSSYLHQTTKNIKDFFAGAKKAAENEPIILFLDEIDSLVSTRTNNVDANKAEEVSQFLQEFNSLESAPNLIVIAATNRPDHLDPAILRSGRLDKKIYLGPPDDEARKALFKMYIEKKGRPHAKLDYDELMILTKDYVSADVEAICDEVARDASRDLLDLVDEAESGKLTEKALDGHKITMDSLRKAIMETPSSLKMVDMSVYESWLEKIK